VQKLDFTTHVAIQVRRREREEPLSEWATHKRGSKMQNVNKYGSSTLWQKGTQNIQCRKFEKPSLDSEMTILLVDYFWFDVHIYGESSESCQGCGVNTFSLFAYQSTGISTLTAGFSGVNLRFTKCIKIFKE
jgi:hypothetical protein